MCGQVAEANAALSIPVQTLRELRLMNHNRGADSILVSCHCDVGVTKLPLRNFWDVGIRNVAELQIKSLARSENHRRNCRLNHKVKRIPFIVQFLPDNCLSYCEISRPSLTPIGDNKRDGIAIWIGRRIRPCGNLYGNIGTQLPSGGIFRASYKLPGGNPKTQGEECEQYFRPMIQPLFPQPMSRVVFMFLIFFGGWFFALRGGEYFDNQRRLLGSALIGSGILLWLGVLLLWFIGRYWWSWCLPI